MPVRTKTTEAAPVEQATTKVFTKENLKTLPDLDLKGILRAAGLDELTEGAMYVRESAIMRILQEQKHGFTEAINPQLIDRFLEKASTAEVAEEPATPAPTKDVTRRGAGNTKITERTTGKGVPTDQEGEGNFQMSAGVVGSVTYGLKEVKNLGNYESLHITVQVTLPLEPTADDLKNAQATMLVAKEMCLQQLNADMDELLTP